MSSKEEAGLPSRGTLRASLRIMARICRRTRASHCGPRRIRTRASSSSARAAPNPRRRSPREGPGRERPAARSHVAALADQPRKATSGRWYCELIDAGWGSAVTQFVGAIPPGRAPDHYHEYEEVLCVLAGEGRMWAGERSTPIAPGSCIYLPRRQTHCVENTGSGELRLLGVFYPAGSPAVRYKTGSVAVTPGS